MIDGFEAWLSAIGLRDADDDDLDPEALAFASKLFRERGPLSLDVTRSLWLDHQRELARRAVDALAHDIQATTGLPAPSFDPRIGGDEIRVTYFGRVAGSPVLGLSETTIVHEVASFFQDEVIEDLQSPWPVCTEHGVGADVDIIEGVAVWHCRFGDHVLARIGSLKRV